jgi:ABC-type polysaccharide/polyol phosphate transport system ATPase subunit
VGTQTPAEVDGAVSEPALQFEHVRKSFRHFASPLHRLRAIFWPFGARHTPVPVLEDINFSVARGESLAIIGANGVGKSTLLHLVAGLLEPSSGRVTVHGDVAALLDLGGSFLPELTGRENARFYHRLVAGNEGDPLARERAVEEFAQLGEFFDRPVRTYSSGMFLRLAFACATVEDPDILLIDEVLAVGDARFQQKCYRRLAELRARGTTILLVTHVMHALTTISDRVLVLEHGRIVYDGEPGRGVDRYYQLFFTAPGHPGNSSTTDELRYGYGGATISQVVAYGERMQTTTAFNAGEPVRIVFDVEFERDVQMPEFGFTCATKEGARIYTTSTGMLGIAPVPASAGDRRSVEVVFRLDTAVGDVFIDVSVFEVVHGAVSVLDARVHVLHLTVATPLHYVGVADVSAVMRFMP